MDVRVLDVGAEPRGPLRLRVRSGTTATLRVKVVRTGEPRPGTGLEWQRLGTPEHLIFEATAVAVGPDGTSRLELRLREALPQESTWDPPRERAFLSATACGLPDEEPSPGAGLAASYELQVHSHRGARLAGAVMQWLWLFSPAFPAEPVGIGARWQVTRRVPTSGCFSSSRATVTYRLSTAMEPLPAEAAGGWQGGGGAGGDVALDVDAIQVVGPQYLGLSEPAAPVHMEGLTRRGGGRIEVALGDLPVALGRTVVEEEAHSVVRFDLASPVLRDELHPVPTVAERKETVLRTEVVVERVAGGAPLRSPGTATPAAGGSQ
ncbi:MAG: hypothetical protein HY908_31780 [Myxococcales bacterium]|nr:hypothetical protein [Myxococcales bacterium]